MIPNLGSAAHLGGLIAGALLALFVGYKRPGQSARVAVWWQVLQFAALALVVVSFGQVARHMGDARPNGAGQNAATTPMEAAVDTYISAMNDGQRAFGQALGGETQNIDSVISRLESVQPLDAKSGQLRDELKELLVRVRDFARQPQAERNSKSGQQQFDKLLGDFLPWQKRSVKWIKNEGQNFGLVVPEQTGTPEDDGKLEVNVSPPEAGKK
jgi:hypothetical protein